MSFINTNTYYINNVGHKTSENCINLIAIEPNLPSEYP